MTTTIAVAGKGGSGKTTISALLIKLLSENGITLAIDADPSTNLHMALGLPLGESVGRVREDMSKAVKKGTFEQGIAKQDYLSLKIQEAVVESPHIDLLSMGRPEGPGCYCAANNMIRSCIDMLAKNYDYVVIDCEAGMEHLSRQTTRDLDILLIVSEPTMKGIATAVLMKDLIKELRTSVDKVFLLLNRVKGHLQPEIAEAISTASLQIIGLIQEDSNIRDIETRGTSIVDLPQDSPLQAGVREVAKKLGLA